MDAVVGTLQSSGAIYAASKLAYFDKMKNERKFCRWAARLSQKAVPSVSSGWHLSLRTHASFLAFYFYSLGSGPGLAG